MAHELALDRPAGLFDRAHEWRDLAQFATSDLPGLRPAIVRGRRRAGKSFLLRHLCRAVGGGYTLALEQSRALAIERFVRSVESATGTTLGAFTDWVGALNAAAGVLGRSDGPFPPLLVSDEFPYLVAHSPELFSRTGFTADLAATDLGRSAVLVGLGDLCGA
jgi:hypothetical protein